MADRPYIQNVPVAYMDLQTLWNDRRAPHANPFSGEGPRRSEARGKASGLGRAVESLFHPGPFDTTASGGVSNKRLYSGQKK